MSRTAKVVIAVPSPILLILSTMLLRMGVTLEAQDRSSSSFPLPPPPLSIELVSGRPGGVPSLHVRYAYRDSKPIALAELMHDISVSVDGRLYRQFPGLMYGGLGGPQMVSPGETSGFDLDLSLFISCGRHSVGWAKGKWGGLYLTNGMHRVVAVLHGKRSNEISFEWPSSIEAVLPGGRPARPVAPHAASKAECLAKGGHWGRFGLLEVDQCDLATTDSGKLCTDHRECQSVCVTDDHVSQGSKTTGHCYDRTVVLGTCMNGVVGGVAQGVICVD